MIINCITFLLGGNNYLEQPFIITNIMQTNFAYFVQRGGLLSEGTQRVVQNMIYSHCLCETEQNCFHYKREVPSKTLQQTESRIINFSRFMQLLQVYNKNPARTRQIDKVNFILLYYMIINQIKNYLIINGGLLFLYKFYLIDFILITYSI